MTVGELIKALEGVPPDTTAVIRVSYYERTSDSFHAQMEEPEPEMHDGVLVLNA